MPKKNAFFYFMLEYKNRQEAKGRQFQGLGQVTPLAGAIWEKMNAKQREPYVKMSKQISPAGQKENLTNLGVPYSHMDSEKREKESKAQRIKSRTMALVTDAATNNVLETQDFYFVSMAYYCVTTEGVYVPAELGAVRYSLEAGVKDKLHMHIYLDSVPLGMAYEAQVHADEDHRLPLPPNALGERDYGKVGDELLKFLLHGDGMPLIFTDREDVQKVEDMLLDILHDRVNEVNLLVCPLAELFFQLKQTTERYMMDQTNFPSVHIAQQIITKDIYDYTKGISCAFHEAQDNVRYCAISRCIRWAYIISDNCCLDMGIEPVAGKHLPVDADTHPTNPNTFETFSYVSHGGDKCSYVSGSTVSRMTYPTVVKSTNVAGDSNADVQQHLGAWGSRSSNDTLPDDKTEVQETIKVEADGNSTFTSTWGEPSTRQLSYGRGMGAMIAGQVNTKIRGVGRGRGMLKDEFPVLGGRGRGARSSFFS